MRRNVAQVIRRQRPTTRVVAVLAVAIVATSSAALARGPEGADPRSEPRAEELREVEHERLRALVDADIGTSRRLHANDFQLINPAGLALSDEEYLAFIATRAVDYLVFEPCRPSRSPCTGSRQ